MLKNIKQIKNLKNKTVLLRGDLDAPIKNGRVVDNFRLMRLLPTIKYLVKNGSKVIIIGHLGRPGGKIMEKFSMKPVAEELRKLLRVDKLCKKSIKSTFVIPCLTRNPVFNNGSRIKCGMTKKEFNGFKIYIISPNICLLENLRFYKGEEKNDLKFSKKLAGFADIYVNDAFANSHREHSSIVGISKLLPSYAGLNFEIEIKNLEKVIKNPKKPAVAIIGGMKLKTKLPLIKKLSDNFDYILVGGRLGIEMEKLPNPSCQQSVIPRLTRDPETSGFSLNKWIPPVSHSARRGGHQAPCLPCLQDRQAAGRRNDKKNFDCVSGYLGNIIVPLDYIGAGKFDIGKKTIKLYTEILEKAKTVVWNGPMGKFEDKKYMNGTRSIANAIKKSKAYSVVGGGDIISALHKLKMLDEFDFVSTGGGAMLEFLEKGDLVGLEALSFKSCGD
ncbi:phosphoglycerate kinase [Patescibacteria group bacterium]